MNSNISKHIAAGNHIVFEKFVDSYYFPLTYFAQRLLGNMQSAEDVVQDAFVRLWENRSKFQDDAHLRNYLYLIVRNYCIDKIRGDSKKTSFPLDEGIRLQEDDISANYIRTETSRLLHEAVSSLPPRARQVMELTLNGMQQEQIASQMGITLSTVKALKADGMKKLKEKLGPLILLLLIP